jgi:hypothetical protein
MAQLCHDRRATSASALASTCGRGPWTGWSDDEVAEVAAAAAALGGTVTEHYVTALLICRPTRTG